MLLIRIKLTAFDKNARIIKSFLRPLALKYFLMHYIGVSQYKRK